MNRREEIIVGEYYHIFNRGVEKRRIFYKKSDYFRFLRSLILFNTEKSSWTFQSISKKEVPLIPEEDERLVDLVAYSINPNHFHLLLREIKENGIATYMKKVCTGYAMYFNKKNERSGILFQGRYRSTHISSNDLLLYISVYVGCNSEVHNIEKAQNYPWCSFPEYINPNKKEICQKDIILNQFKDRSEYKQFCLDKIVGMQEKKEDEYEYEFNK